MVGIHGFKEISLNMVCAEAFAIFRSLCLVERLGLSKLVIVLFDSLMVVQNVYGASRHSG